MCICIIQNCVSEACVYFPFLKILFLPVTTPMYSSSSKETQHGARVCIPRVYVECTLTLNPHVLGLRKFFREIIRLCECYIVVRRITSIIWATWISSRTTMQCSVSRERGCIWILISAEAAEAWISRVLGQRCRCCCISTTGCRSSLYVNPWFAIFRLLLARHK